MGQAEWSNIRWNIHNESMVRRGTTAGCQEEVGKEAQPLLPMVDKRARDPAPPMEKSEWGGVAALGTTLLPAPVVRDSKAHNLAHTMSRPLLDECWRLSVAAQT